jgi:glycosyltransferase involved in cell wall biosynthesis
MAHNVDSLIWQRYWQTLRNPLKRLFVRGQWRKFERFERHALHQAERVVAVSAADAALIRDQFAQARVDVVDNGIDREFFAQASGRRDPQRILFLGALDWRPNLDAIALLLERIFPEVRARIPQATLAIVGRNPAPALIKRIAATAGAELHANVGDVRPYLSSAAVMAVPLRIGGGSRLKILEALATGLPVVSSKIGAEGLALRPDEHYVQAEEDAMAAALVAALGAPARMQAQAERGRAVVLEQYGWDVLARKLEQSWEKCVAPAAGAERHAAELARRRKHTEGKPWASPGKLEFSPCGSSS